MSLNTGLGAFVIFSLAVALSGCATESDGQSATGRVSTDASALPVVDAVQGKEIHLRRGQLLAIELASNASTGYGWEVVEAGDPVLAAAPVPASNAPSATPMPGAGGTSRWRYRAMQAGTALVRLVYRRSWEKDVEPARTATYRVRVE
ncbi:MAG: protease inhibitor I42 family protein [Pseudoxanthomonas sp.]